MNRRGFMRRRLPAAALCLILAGQFSLQVLAGETVTEMEDGRIVVLYDAGPVSGGGAETMPPADTYLWQGQEYELQSFQAVPAVMPEIVRYARETVLYEGVEQAEQIPDTLEVHVSDEDTGRDVLAELPLETSSSANGRWTGGFEFPVTVWEYDAGRFALGDKIVEVREENPFEGCEEQLLQLIGADPAYYQIDSVSWSGEAETDEYGRIYRRAAACGRKYVADVEAVYGGTVRIPEQPGEAWEAVYELRRQEEPKETPAAEPEIQEEIRSEPVPAAAPAAEPEEKPEGLLAMLWRTRRVTTIVVGLGILIVPVLLFLMWKRKKKEESDGGSRSRRRARRPLHRRTAENKRKL